MTNKLIEALTEARRNYHNYTIEDRVKLLFNAREFVKVYNTRLSEDMKEPVEVELSGAAFKAEVLPADGKDVILKPRDYVRIRENRNKLEKD